ncbi:MAG: glycosyltransferase family 2 protein, partial [Planctomycetota bacterium]
TRLLGGEDTELAIRLLRAGHRLRYVPGARVYHPVAPERMAWEFVMHRHRMLGRETVIMSRELGEEVPTAARLRRELRRSWGGPLRRLVRPRHRKRRRALRRAMYEGALEEVSGP